jgi:iron complex transport system substrate-binding protein
LAARSPQRIVCLTEETTETLYLLGEEDRIVGISGFTMRPPRARKEKPKVSTFTEADTRAILDLAPDLVIGFSDLQADLARDLVRAGLNVLVFNQRSVEEILAMMETLGRIVEAGDRAGDLVGRMRDRLDDIEARSAGIPVRPKVYFEEWFDPLISGIRWVSELIEIAGGQDCFEENSTHPHARDRIIADAGEVVRRNPDVIVGSWCGKMFKPDRVRARPGWDAVNAVRNNQLFEIKSTDILQPGPAALTDGVDRLHEIFAAWSRENANRS